MSHRPSRSRGVTLIEVATVLAIASILIGGLVPGWKDVRERHRVQAIAALLETDVQLTRSEAVARNQGLRLDFGADAGGSCYVVHDGAAGDCRCSSGAAPTCVRGAEAMRSVSIPAADGVELRSNSASLRFEPMTATVTPTATMRVVSGSATLHQIVNIMGRVRTCSPDGRIAGIERC